MMTSLNELINTIDEEISETAIEKKEDKGASTGTLTAGMEQYVCFHLDNILLALLLSKALEIGQKPDITPLPNLPDWVLGVSNIRGEIISIVDLKGFFKIPQPAIIQR